MADIESSKFVGSREAYIYLRRDEADGWEFIQIDCWNREIGSLGSKSTIRIYDDDEKWETFRSLFP